MSLIDWVGIAMMSTMIIIIVILVYMMVGVWNSGEEE